MEVEQFFKENIKPLINDKIWEQEDYVDASELSSYNHYDAWLNHEPSSDDYDEDEMYAACVQELIDRIKHDGVLDTFYNNLSKEAINELQNAAVKEIDAIDEMTLNYVTTLRQEVLK